MVKGNFLYDHEDITVGVEARRRVWPSSGCTARAAATRSGPLGKGLDAQLQCQRSGQFGRLPSHGRRQRPGRRRRRFRKQGLAGTCCKTASRPLANVVAAVPGPTLVWRAADRQHRHRHPGPQGGSVFVKLPDGSYNPPPGQSAKLTQNPDGTYNYENGATAALLRFNAAGKLAYSHRPQRHTAQIHLLGQRPGPYRSQNSLGRSLGLYQYRRAHHAGQRRQQKPSNYAYDASANLTSFRQHPGQGHHLWPTALPGQLTSLYYPSFPGTAAG